MTKKEQIEKASQTAINYPDLAQKLIGIGVESYTIDVATQSTLYRFANGETHIDLYDQETRKIVEPFNYEAVKNGIIANQTRKTDFEGFMQDMAEAGVFFFEATLIGGRKRVTYIGKQGFHEELIPIS